jgi:hypothetical protein
MFRRPHDVSQQEALVVIMKLASTAVMPSVNNKCPSCTVERWVNVEESVQWRGCLQ